MSGLEVLQEIKKFSPRTPVIVITAYGVIQDAVDAMKRGASDYILKPFSFEALSASVRRALLDERHPAIPGAGDQKQREIVTGNAKMSRCIALAKSIALSRSTVLIQGESGTGKELLARFIHQHSDCNDKLFVARTPRRFRQSHTIQANI